MKLPDILSSYIQNHYPELLQPINRQRFNAGLTTLLIALVLLTLDRFGLQSYFFRQLAPIFFPDAPHNDLRFYSQIHFTASVTVLFLCIPMLFHIAFPIDNNYNYGTGIRSAYPHLPVYIFAFLGMAPILWIVTGNPAFNRFYPMYHPETLSAWLIFESFYLAHFFPVEFFFRGFGLYRLEKLYGNGAIFIMMIPYALIHIYKPIPEALGSIPAGIILGYLSIKGRSIWPGVALHAMVAFFTDFFSLIQSGRLATLNW